MSEPETRLGIAPGPAKRRVGMIVGLCIAGVVVLVIAGYVTWGILAANAHNSEWASQVTDISKVHNATVTSDHTAVTFVSGATSPCTAEEVQTISATIIHQFVLDGLGGLPASITQPIADKAAQTQCATQKTAAFAKAVSDTQVELVVFLKVIGAPDSIASTTDGLRGLDGTQTTEFSTPNVGHVTMHARYDGTNGLSVSFTREQETLDWGAPLGR